MSFAGTAVHANLLILIRFNTEKKKQQQKQSARWNRECGVNSGKSKLNIILNF